MQGRKCHRKRPQNQRERGRWRRPTAAAATATELHGRCHRHTAVVLPMHFGTSICQPNLGSTNWRFGAALYDDDDYAEDDENPTDHYEEEEHNGGR